MRESARRRAKKLAEVRARSDFAKFAKAGRADARGREVPPTVDGYENAAAGGHRLVAEALIARHNARMQHVSAVPEWLRMAILSCTIPAIQLGTAARALGADPRRPPSSMGSTWVDQLMWGVDSLIAASRLLLVGQVAGAAVIARNQIEMWTESRASISGISKDAKESVADFIARAWSEQVDPKKIRKGSSLGVAFDDPDQYAASDPLIEHKHVLVAGGAELCPALTWMTLSELLHGRQFPAVSAWDATCLATDPDDDVVPGIELVVGALRLSIFHMRKLLLVTAVDVGATGTARLLEEEMDDFSEAKDQKEGAPVTHGHALPMPSDSIVPPLSFLAPLLPNEGLSKRAFMSLENASEAFEGVVQGERPAGRLYRDDEIATAAFGWHRYRSAVVAQESLTREARELGDLHNPLSLAWRANVWVFVGEAAALLGLWMPEGGRRDAALMTASSLRSSWWLWLEDDDRAMAVLRVVLEQVCRLRVWRLKPDKAKKLEEHSTPRDWIENSGWRRLGPLNKALGEFAHLNSRSNWEHARDILTKIQRDSDPRTAPFTARRAAAELVTQLGASEVREQMRQYSPAVADAVANLFAEVGATPGEEEKYLNERLDYIWAFRQSSSDAAD